MRGLLLGAVLLRGVLALPRPGPPLQRRQKVQEELAASTPVAELSSPPKANLNSELELANLVAVHALGRDDAVKVEVPPIPEAGNGIEILPLDHPLPDEVYQAHIFSDSDSDSEDSNTPEAPTLAADPGLTTDVKNAAAIVADDLATDAQIAGPVIANDISENIDAAGAAISKEAEPVVKPLEAAASDVQSAGAAALDTVEDLATAAAAAIGTGMEALGEAIVDIASPSEAAIVAAASGVSDAQTTEPEYTVDVRPLLLVDTFNPKTGKVEKKGVNVLTAKPDLVGKVQELIETSEGNIDDKVLENLVESELNKLAVELVKGEIATDKENLHGKVAKPELKPLESLQSLAVENSDLIDDDEVIVEEFVLENEAAFDPIEVKVVEETVIAQPEADTEATLSPQEQSSIVSSFLSHLAESTPATSVEKDEFTTEALPEATVSADTAENIVIPANPASLPPKDDTGIAVEIPADEADKPLTPPTNPDIGMSLGMKITKDIGFGKDVKDASDSTDSSDSEYYTDGYDSYDSSDGEFSGSDSNESGWSSGSDSDSGYETEKRIQNMLDKSDQDDEKESNPYGVKPPSKDKSKKATAKDKNAKHGNSPSKKSYDKSNHKEDSSNKESSKDGHSESHSENKESSVKENHESSEHKEASHDSDKGSKGSGTNASHDGHPDDKSDNKSSDKSDSHEGHSEGKAASSNEKDNKGSDEAHSKDMSISDKSDSKDSNAHGDAGSAKPSGDEKGDQDSHQDASKDHKDDSHDDSHDKDDHSQSNDKKKRPQKGPARKSRGRVITIHQSDDKSNEDMEPDSYTSSYSEQNDGGFYPPCVNPANQGTAEYYERRGSRENHNSEGVRMQEYRGWAIKHGEMERYRAYADANGYYSQEHDGPMGSGAYPPTRNGYVNPKDYLPGETFWQARQRLWPEIEAQHRQEKGFAAPEETYATQHGVDMEQFNRLRQVRLEQLEREKAEEAKRNSRVQESHENNEKAKNSYQNEKENSNDSHGSDKKESSSKKVEEHGSGKDTATPSHKSENKKDEHASEKTTSAHVDVKKDEHAPEETPASHGDDKKASKSSVKHADSGKQEQPAAGKTSDGHAEKSTSKSSGKNADFGKNEQPAASKSHDDKVSESHADKPAGKSSGSGKQEKSAAGKSAESHGDKKTADVHTNNSTEKSNDSHETKKAESKTSMTSNKDKDSKNAGSDNKDGHANKDTSSARAELKKSDNKASKPSTKNAEQDTAHKEASSSKKPDGEASKQPAHNAEQDNAHKEVTSHDETKKSDIKASKPSTKNTEQDNAHKETSTPRGESKKSDDKASKPPAKHTEQDNSHKEQSTPAKKEQSGSKMEAASSGSGSASHKGESQKPQEHSDSSETESEDEARHASGSRPGGNGQQGSKDSKVSAAGKNAHKEGSQGGAQKPGSSGVNDAHSASEKSNKDGHAQQKSAPAHSDSENSDNEGYNSPAPAHSESDNSDNEGYDSPAPVDYYSDEEAVPYYPEEWYPEEGYETDGFGYPYEPMHPEDGYYRSDVETGYYSDRYVDGHASAYGSGFESDIDEEEHVPASHSDNEGSASESDDEAHHESAPVKGPSGGRKADAGKSDSHSSNASTPSKDTSSSQRKESSLPASNESQDKDATRRPRPSPIDSSSREAEGSSDSMHGSGSNGDNSDGHDSNAPKTTPLSEVVRKLRETPEWRDLEKKSKSESFEHNGESQTGNGDKHESHGQEEQSPEHGDDGEHQRGSDNEKEHAKGNVSPHGDSADKSEVTSHGSNGSKGHSSPEPTRTRRRRPHVPNQTQRIHIDSRNGTNIVPSSLPDGSNGVRIKFKTSADKASAGGAGGSAPEENFDGDEDAQDMFDNTHRTFKNPVVDHAMGKLNRQRVKEEKKQRGGAISKDLHKEIDANKAANNQAQGQQGQGQSQGSRPSGSGQGNNNKGASQPGFDEDGNGKMSIHQSESSDGRRPAAGNNGQSGHGSESGSGSGSKSGSGSDSGAGSGPRNDNKKPSQPQTVQPARPSRPAQPQREEHGEQKPPARKGDNKKDSRPQEQKTGSDGKDSDSHGSNGSNDSQRSPSSGSRGSSGSGRPSNSDNSRGSDNSGAKNSTESRGSNNARPPRPVQQPVQQGPQNQGFGNGERKQTPVPTYKNENNGSNQKNQTSYQSSKDTPSADEILDSVSRFLGKKKFGEEAKAVKGDKPSYRSMKENKASKPRSGNDTLSHDIELNDELDLEIPGDNDGTDYESNDESSDMQRLPLPKFIKGERRPAKDRVIDKARIAAEMDRDDVVYNSRKNRERPSSVESSGELNETSHGKPSHGQSAARRPVPLPVHSDTQNDTVKATPGKPAKGGKGPRPAGKVTLGNTISNGMQNETRKNPYFDDDEHDDHKDTKSRQPKAFKAHPLEHDKPSNDTSSHPKLSLTDIPEYYVYFDERDRPTLYRADGSAVFRGDSDYPEEDDDTEYPYFYAEVDSYPNRSPSASRRKFGPFNFYQKGEHGRPPYRLPHAKLGSPVGKNLTWDFKDKNEYPFITDVQGATPFGRYYGPAECYGRECFVFDDFGRPIIIVIENVNNIDNKNDNTNINNINNENRMEQTQQQSADVANHYHDNRQIDNRVYNYHMNGPLFIDEDHYKTRLPGHDEFITVNKNCGCYKTKACEHCHPATRMAPALPTPVHYKGPVITPLVNNGSHPLIEKLRQNKPHVVNGEVIRPAVVHGPAVHNVTRTSNIQRGGKPRAGYAVPAGYEVLGGPKNETVIGSHRGGASYGASCPKAGGHSGPYGYGSECARALKERYAPEVVYEKPCPSKVCVKEELVKPKVYEVVTSVTLSPTVIITTTGVPTIISITPPPETQIITQPSKHIVQTVHIQQPPTIITTEIPQTITVSKVVEIIAPPSSLLVQLPATTIVQTPAPQIITVTPCPTCKHVTETKVLPPITHTQPPMEVVVVTPPPFISTMTLPPAIITQTPPPITTVIQPCPTCVKVTQTIALPPVSVTITQAPVVIPESKTVLLMEAPQTEVVQLPPTVITETPPPKIVTITPCPQCAVVTSTSILPPITYTKQPPAVTVERPPAVTNYVTLPPTIITQTPAPQIHYVTPPAVHQVVREQVQRPPVYEVESIPQTVQDYKEVIITKPAETITVTLSGAVITSTPAPVIETVQPCPTCAYETQTVQLPPVVITRTPEVVYSVVPPQTITQYQPAVTVNVPGIQQTIVKQQPPVHQTVREQVQRPPVYEVETVPQTIIEYREIPISRLPETVVLTLPAVTITSTPPPVVETVKPCPTCVYETQTIELPPVVITNTPEVVYMPKDVVTRYIEQPPVQVNVPPQTIVRTIEQPAVHEVNTFWVADEPVYITSTQEAYTMPVTQYIYDEAPPQTITIDMPPMVITQTPPPVTSTYKPCQTCAYTTETIKLEPITFTTQQPVVTIEQQTFISLVQGAVQTQIVKPQPAFNVIQRPTVHEIRTQYIQQPGKTDVFTQPLTVQWPVEQYNVGSPVIAVVELAPVTITTTPAPVTSTYKPCQTCAYETTTIALPPIVVTTTPHETYTREVPTRYIQQPAQTKIVNQPMYVQDEVEQVVYGNPVVEVVTLEPVVITTTPPPAISTYKPCQTCAYETTTIELPPVVITTTPVKTYIHDAQTRYIQQPAQTKFANQPMIVQDEIEQVVFGNPIIEVVNLEPVVITTTPPPVTSTFRPCQTCAYETTTIALPPVVVTTTPQETFVWEVPTFVQADRIPETPLGNNYPQVQQQAYAPAPRPSVITIPARTHTFHEFDRDVVETAPAITVTITEEPGAEITDDSEPFIEIILPGSVETIYFDDGDFDIETFLGTTVEVTPARDQIATATYGQFIQVTVPAHVEVNNRGQEVTRSEIVTVVPYTPRPVDPPQPVVTITAPAFTTEYVDEKSDFTAEHVIPATTLTLTRPTVEEFYPPSRQAFQSRYPQNVAAPTPGTSSEIVQVEYVPQPPARITTVQQFAPVYSAATPTEDEQPYAFVTTIPAHFETILPANNYEEAVIGYVSEEAVEVIIDDSAADEGGPIVAITPERVQTIQAVSMGPMMVRTIPASTYTLSSRPTFVSQLPESVIITTSFPAAIQTVQTAVAFNPPVVYSFAAEQATFTIARDVISSAIAGGASIISTQIAPVPGPLRGGQSFSDAAPARPVELAIPAVTPSRVLQLDIPALAPAPLPGYRTPMAAPTPAPRFNNRPFAVRPADIRPDQYTNIPTRSYDRIPIPTQPAFGVQRDIIPPRLSSFFVQLISYFNGTVPSPQRPAPLPAPLPQNIPFPPLIVNLFSYFRNTFNGTVPTQNATVLRGYVDDYFRANNFSSSTLAAFYNSSFYQAISNVTAFTNLTGGELNFDRDTSNTLLRNVRELTPLPLFDVVNRDVIENEDDNEGFTSVTPTSVTSVAVSLASGRPFPFRASVTPVASSVSSVVTPSATRAPFSFRASVSPFTTSAAVPTTGATTRRFSVAPAASSALTSASRAPARPSVAAPSPSSVVAPVTTPLYPRRNLTEIIRNAVPRVINDEIDDDLDDIFDDDLFDFKLKKRSMSEYEEEEEEEEVYVDNGYIPEVEFDEYEYDSGVRGVATTDEDHTSHSVVIEEEKKTSAGVKFFVPNVTVLFGALGMWLAMLGVGLW